MSQLRVEDFSYGIWLKHKLVIENNNFNLEISITNKFVKKYLETNITN